MILEKKISITSENRISDVRIKNRSIVEVKTENEKKIS